MPDSVLDAIPDAAGLRAVRAKVHAEASAVCPNCGRRHLLDSHCSGAPDVVRDVEPPPLEPPAAADALHANRFVATPDDPRRGGDHGAGAGAHLDPRDEATTPTTTEAAPERDVTQARRLFGSVIAYLGLDSASFGAVDDDLRGVATDADAPGYLWREPDDAPPPRVGPQPPRVQRIVAFLGIDVGAVDRVRAPDVNEDVLVPSSTVSDAEADDEDGDEPAPVEPIATIESPIDVDARGTPVVAASDASRHYWRRTDDDILYRPSRRPRSPRRAWRDRMASRG